MSRLFRSLVTRTLSLVPPALVLAIGGLAFPAAGAAAPRPPRAPAPVLSPEYLALRPAGRSGRAPVHQDAVEAQIVAGTWSAPKAGDTVRLPDGSLRAWTEMTASAAPDGWLTATAPAGGYLFMTAAAGAPQVMLLEAMGDSMVYVNGEPRVGDPYETGWVRLPVLLRQGGNSLLFQCARGRVRVRLTAPAAAAVLDTHDLTLPDRVVDERTPVLGAVVVINATTRPLTGLVLRATAVMEQGRGMRSSGPLGHGTVTAVPEIPPLSLRKVAFRWSGPAVATPGNTELALALVQRRSGSSRALDTAKITVRVRRPAETQKRTFISDIDGSVQYYAVNPAPPSTGSEPPALFLSLHGAGVEAIGQADAYESKLWGDLVAPTNRRPYGFDWEDWGCLDALEVLDLAQKQLHTDPRRTYLVGHSMGGHGTWHLGVTFPDRFAAIGPSAGWISFASYAGAPRYQNPTPMEQMLQRAALPSDTLALVHNCAQEGVYILHGSADDNVPVAQAREMNRQLSTFHHDYVYFEQPSAGHWWDVSDEPGADCVDWAPMFDFLAHHTIPDEDSVRQVDFSTADPGVSAQCHWAGIEAQTHPLEISSISIRCDPGRRRFVGTTTNVARLSLRLPLLRGEETLSIELDGQKLDGIPMPAARQLWLGREGGEWRVIAPPSPAMKWPERCGPFKQAFRHRMLFVYGTKGTPEENTWAFAKARYDAETFWYRGNGSIDVVSDTAFDATKERDRSVILYGNAQTNAAWSALLDSSPVVAREGSVRAGSHSISGSDLACLFVRPRPGSLVAEVGVVGGTGLAGMRLTDRLPYFLSGVEYPDLIVLGPEMLTHGAKGVRAAGFFGLDWGVEDGELVWQE